jgi:hypothetical protein
VSFEQHKHHLARMFTQYQQQESLAPSAAIRTVSAASHDTSSEDGGRRGKTRIKLMSYNSSRFEYLPLLTSQVGVST